MLRSYFFFLPLVLFYALRLFHSMNLPLASREEGESVTVLVFMVLSFDLFGCFTRVWFGDIQVIQPHYIGSSESKDLSST